MAAAPDDLDILEFALKWRINPQEIREKWHIRDIRWLEIVEQAQILAEPEIRRKAAARAQRKSKRKK